MFLGVPANLNDAHNKDGSELLDLKFITNSEIIVRCEFGSDQNIFFIFSLKSDK